MNELEFEVGDWVFLKVSSMKGVIRFGGERKINSRFIGSYQIVHRMSQVAHELELSVHLESIPCLYSL